MRVTTIPPSGFVDWGYQQSLSSVSGSYTLAREDAGKIILIDSESANTLTVPSSLTVDFPIGTHITIVQKGSGQTTIFPGAQTVLLQYTTTNKLRSKYSTASIIKIGVDEWLLFGDLAVV